MYPLGSFFKMAKPTMTCSHTRARLLGVVDGQHRLRCLSCGAEFGKAAKSEFEGIPHIAGMKHDPYEYPSEQGVWHKGRCGITPDEARKIQRQNKALSENARESKQGGRLRARIPAALFWAQRRADPHYWDNKKNLDRVAKDWGISR